MHLQINLEHNNELLTNKYRPDVSSIWLLADAQLTLIGYPNLQSINYIVRYGTEKCPTELNQDFYIHMPPIKSHNGKGSWTSIEIVHKTIRWLQEKETRCQ